MYEDSNKAIDWKGLFLKVIIVFLILLIGFKSYSILNDNKNVTKTTETVAKAKNSSTFTKNMEKLKKSGEDYFTNNTDKLPTKEGNTSMITLNELISSGTIEKLSDEDGNNCDGESSYVTAIKEGEKVKIKANLVCGSASSYSLVYMGQNDTTTKQTKTTTSSDGTSTSKTTTNTTVTKDNTKTCGNSCSTPTVNVKTDTKIKQEININTDKDTKKTKETTTTKVRKEKEYNKVYTTDTVTVRFDSRDGDKTYANQKVRIGEKAYNPGSTSKYGYTFIGWYTSDGYEYNFNTPVNKNITLYAHYVEDYDTYNSHSTYTSRSSSRRIYSNYEPEYTQTTEQRVYTIGWNSYGSKYISINHTLRLPSVWRNSNKIKAVRIKYIEFESPLTTLGQLNVYKNNHSNTFFYQKNGWEYDFPSYWNDPNTLAKVNSNRISFNYNPDYISYYDALNYGVDVTWTANGVEKQCKQTFTVNDVSGLCNYGIIYKVTWEYIK